MIKLNNTKTILKQVNLSIFQMINFYDNKISHNDLADFIAGIESDLYINSDDLPMYVITKFIGTCEHENISSKLRSYANNFELAFNSLVACEVRARLEKNLERLGERWEQDEYTTSDIMWEVFSLKHSDF